MYFGNDLLVTRNLNLDPGERSASGSPALLISNANTLGNPEEWAFDNYSCRSKSRAWVVWVRDGICREDDRFYSDPADALGINYSF